MFSIPVPQRLAKAFPELVITDEQRDNSLGSLERPSGDLLDILGASPAIAGVRVSQDSAMGLIAVYAAVRALAEGVAMLPFHMFETSDTKGRVRISRDEDPRAEILDEYPNPEMTSFELWEMVMGHMLLWGNAYIYREFSGKSGLTTALWPLRPDNTRPFRTSTGEKWYVTYSANGEERLLDPNEVIHVRAFGTTADVGISPIGRARQAIGIGLAADEYAGRFFQNDANPGGIIKYQGSPTDEQFNKLLARWQSSHQGLKRSHAVGILTGGADWQEVGAPTEDAVFIGARKWQVEEIARLYRVPTHLLMSTEPGAVSYASVEQFSKDFVTFSLTPWLKRIETQVKRGMFSSSIDIQQGLYPEFVTEALLRADPKTQADIWKIEVEGGWRSRNEIRQLLNLSKEEGLDEFAGVTAEEPAPEPAVIPQPLDLPELAKTNGQAV